MLNFLAASALECNILQLSTGEGPTLFEPSKIKWTGTKNDPAPGLPIHKFNGP